MLKRLNILIILLLLFISTDLFSGKNEWKMLPVPEFFHNIPGTKEFYYLSCYDSLNCMAYLQYQGPCGNLIIRTTDGGINWTNVYFDTCQFGNQSVPFPCQIKAIAYTSPNLFIAVGDSGFVLRSTDEGLNWSSYNFNKDRLFYRLNMLNEAIGYSWGGITNKNEYYKTSDSGKSWTVLNSNKYFDGKYVDAIQAINKDLFYTLYWEPSDKSMRLLRVHGNWESWDTTLVCYGYNIHHFYFINKDTGWVAGKHQIGTYTLKQFIMKTEDGGYTWKIQLDTNISSDGVNDIKFFNHKYGFATSGFWCMLQTSDGGNSWESNILAPDTISLKYQYSFWGLQVPTQSVAYVIGYGNNIWKYTRDWTSSPDTPPAEHSGIYLSPNPASDYIDIRLVDVILLC